MALFKGVVGVWTVIWKRIKKQSGKSELKGGFNINIEIYPLEKVVIDGISIYLGMNQSAVEAAIGKGEPVEKRYYYYNNDMAIDYNDNNTVEFIEFLGGIDGSLHPVIYGVSAFDTLADELADLLRQKNDGEIDDSEQGYSFAFLNISVGVYREIRPYDVNEMIEEMKADGIPVENNEDVAAEMRKANHWATIGVGVAGYYQH